MNLEIFHPSSSFMTTKVLSIPNSAAIFIEAASLSRLIYSWVPLPGWRYTYVCPLQSKQKEVLVSPSLIGLILMISAGVTFKVSQIFNNIFELVCIK